MGPTPLPFSFPPGVTELASQRSEHGSFSTDRSRSAVQAKARQAGTNPTPRAWPLQSARPAGGVSPLRE